MTENNKSTLAQVDLSVRRATCISTTVLSILLGILTSGGNGFLLYVLYKDPLRVLRRPVSVFIGALAVVDFLTGIVCDFDFALHEFDCAIGMNNDVGYLGNFSGIAYFFSVNSALVLVAVLSVERFIAVAFPYYYRSSITAKKILIVVVIIYTYTFVFAMLQLAQIPEMIYTQIDVYLNTILPFGIIFISYTAIYIVMRKRRNVAHPNLAPANQEQRPVAVENAQRETRNQKIEQQLISTAFTILLCMIFSLIPYFVFIFLEIECTSCRDTNWFYVGRRVCVPFMFMNSVVNPVIYALRIQRFKNSFNAVLHRPVLQVLANRPANSGQQVAALKPTTQSSIGLQ